MSQHMVKLSGEMYRNRTISWKAPDQQQQSGGAEGARVGGRRCQASQRGRVFAGAEPESLRWD